MYGSNFYESDVTICFLLWSLWFDPSQNNSSGLFKNSGWNIQKTLAHQNPDTLIDGILLLYAIAMYTLKIHRDKLTLWIEGQNDEVFFAHFFILTRHFLTSLTKKIGLHYQGKINFCRKKKRLKSNFVHHTSTSVYHRHLICHVDHLKLFSLNNEYTL